MKYPNGIRLRRKEKNGNGNPNQYRVAYDMNNRIVIMRTGDTFLAGYGPYPQWVVFLEDGEDEGALYSGSWRSILERYEVVDEKPKWNGAEL